MRSPEPLRLRLPATSANLGPAFDAAALALALYLEVEASSAAEFSIQAAGREAPICAALEGNLLLETYKQTCARYGKAMAPPLALTVRNGIPLGMGCGSSGASRLAGVALASHFGDLGWGIARMLDEAAELEGHPDNAAACCYGGFTVSGYDEASSAPSLRRVRAVSFPPPPDWHALLVLPGQPLATTMSRAILPPLYSREAAVANLQSVALLTAAFATGDGALLAAGTHDRLHQPFRGEACPLLPRLLPLRGQSGILSVTLSGAGSGVLLLLAGEEALPSAQACVREAALAPDPLPIAELLPCALVREPAMLQNGTSVA